MFDLFCFSRYGAFLLLWLAAASMQKVDVTLVFTFKQTRSQCSSFYHWFYQDRMYWRDFWYTLFLLINCMYFMFNTCLNVMFYYLVVFVLFFSLFWIYSLTHGLGNKDFSSYNPSKLSLFCHRQLVLNFVNKKFQCHCW